MRRRSLLIASTLSCTAVAWAAPKPPAEIAAAWPQARQQGRGYLRFVGLRVYDARLWVPSDVIGADSWPQRAFALELIYARSLVGRQIAERSLAEMRRAGPISDEQASRWLAAMTELFPDVRAGDRITGLHDPAGAARFYLNGTLRGEKRDGEFAQRFFGIWLAPQTSEPRLRSALLAL